MPCVSGCGNAGCGTIRPGLEHPIMHRVIRWISYGYVIKYRLSHAFRRRSGVNTQPRSLKVLVSLTSYPARLPTVFLAIESLLNQTLKPDRIILWLSKTEVDAADIPASLIKLQSRGLDIRFVDENIKSYKKLVYAVETFSDHHIVTFDDDMMCPKWFLQRLYHTHRQHPDCLVAYRGRVMSKSGDRQLRPYHQWPFCNSAQHNGSGPSYNIFPTSGGGTWYPPHSLDARLSDRVFMTLCPTGDDIWFKAMSMLACTRAVIAQCNSVTFPTIHIRRSQAQTLWEHNRRANDRQLKAVFDHFNLYHLIT